MSTPEDDLFSAIVERTTLENVSPSRRFVETVIGAPAAIPEVHIRTPTELGFKLQHGFSLVADPSDNRSLYMIPDSPRSMEDKTTAIRKMLEEADVIDKNNPLDDHRSYAHMRGPVKVMHGGEEVLALRIDISRRAHGKNNGEPIEFTRDDLETIIRARTEGKFSELAATKKVGQIREYKYQHRAEDIKFDSLEDGRYFEICFATPPVQALECLLEHNVSKNLGTFRFQDGRIFFQQKDQPEVEITLKPNPARPADLDVDIVMPTNELPAMEAKITNSVRTALETAVGDDAVKTRELSFVTIPVRGLHVHLEKILEEKLAGESLADQVRIELPTPEPFSGIKGKVADLEEIAGRTEDVRERTQMVLALISPKGGPESRLNMGDLLERYQDAKIRQTQQGPSLEALAVDRAPTEDLASLGLAGARKDGGIRR